MLKRLLVTGMVFSLFTPTVADDLGVFGIIGDPLAMVIGAPLPLAFRPAADVLLRVEVRCGERLLAVPAAARQNISSEERLRSSEEIRI